MGPGNLKILNKLIIALVLIGGFFAFQNSAQAAPGINKQVNFQGKVTNSDGTNVANGNYNFNFRIYTVSSAGSAIWSELTKSLTVTDGIFQTNLGDATALPGSVDFNSDNIYLGIEFNGNGEMSPRVQFTAAPYAFNTDLLDGKDWTNPGTIGTSATTLALASNGTSAWTNTSGNLTISTATSGTLAVTSAGALNLTGSGASYFNTTSGNINLEAAGTGTANVQIGDGGATSATPDLLVLDIGSAEPAGTNGAMYYSTNLNKFRCYQNAGWADCIGTGGSGPWTDGTGITYLTDTAEDFAVGGSALASPFSVDISANTTRIGSGSTNNGILNMYASDADTGSLEYTTNDSWYFNGGNVGIGDSTPAELLTVGNGDLFNVNASGDVLANFTVLNGSTTASSGKTSSTSLDVASGTNFDVGNYVQVNSTGCRSGINVCYAKVTAKSSNNLTITPALTWANSSNVYEYHVPEIGGTDTASTLANRYGRGYFIGGTVAGNTSTFYMDGQIYTGDQTGGDSIDMSITTGNTTTSGNSGNVRLDAGSAAGTAGMVLLGDVNAAGVKIGSGAGSLTIDTSATNDSILIEQGTNDSTLSFTQPGSPQTYTFATGGTVTTLGNSTTGSGSIALASSPVFTTPTLGAASATTINGLSLTANAVGLSIAGGTTSKTLTINNTMTLAAGADGQTFTFPATSGTIALTTDIHAAVTLGTANGLSLSTQQLSLGAASSGVTGALTGTDWDTFNGKMTNPMTTAGDIMYGGASGAPTRLGEGTNDGYVLKINTTTHVPYWSLDLTGGSQTPWAQDISAAGYDLGSLSNLGFQETTGAPTGTDVGLHRDNSGDLTANVLTGKTFNFAVNGADEFNFSSTGLAFNGNNITGLGTNLTATAGLTIAATGANALNLTGGAASAWNIGANALTITSSNFNTTATGINSTAIGATTASTGAFSTLSSTGATNLATAGASNVTIATTGTGTVAIGNATGTFALASSGGLNVSTGGALTGVASIDTIGVTATGLTFAGTGAINSTTTGLSFNSGNNTLTVDATDTAISATGVTTLTLGAGVSITNASGNINLQAAGTGTANVQIGDGGATSATPDMLVLDIGSAEPAGTVGAMYYSTALSKFRCYQGAAWTDCIGTGGGAQTPWAQDVSAAGYDLGSLSNLGFQETTGAPTGTDVGLYRDNTGDLTANVLTGKTFNFAVNGADEFNFSSTGLAFNSNDITGLGANLTAAGALTIDSASTNALSFGTGANAKTITIGNGTTTTTLNLNSGTGGINLEAAGTSTTDTIQIGAGGAGSTTPDVFALDVKSNTGDPAGFEGAMYYNTSDNVFRCYQATAWTNCIGSGSGGTPAGNTTEVQFNNAGAFGANAGLTFNSTNQTLGLNGTDAEINMTGITNEPSAAAAGTLTTYVKSIGGRMMPKWIGPSGVDTAFQPFIGANHIAHWGAGGGTTMSNIGYAGVSATGTATALAVNTTNLYGSMSKVTYRVTTASTTAVAGARGATANWYLSNVAGRGGFYFVMRGGPDTGVATTTSRFFMGMTASTSAPTDVEPSTIANQIGLGYDAADSSLQIIARNGTTLTKTSLNTATGTTNWNVPTTNNTDMYELVLFAPPNTTTIEYRVTNLITGAQYSSNTAAGPAVNTLLAPRIWSSVGGTSSVIGVALVSMYLETDY